MDWRAYVKYSGLYSLYYFALTIINPVLAPYLKQAGLSDITLSLVFSLTPLFIIFSAPITGYLSDRLGRNTVIRAALLGQVVAVTCYMAGDTVLVGVARVIQALSGMTAGTVFVAKVEDIVDEDQRGKYTGIVMSVQYLGKFLGPLAGGFLADAFVHAPFAISIALLLVLYWTLPHDTSGEVSDDPNWTDQLQTFLSHTKLRGMAVLGMIMHGSHPAFKLFLPVYVVEQLNLSFAHAGLAYSVMGCMHFFQFVAGGLADRDDALSVMAGTFIAGCFTVGVAFTASYTALLVLLFLKGVGNTLWNTAAWTLMSTVGERENIEGEVVGSYMATAKVGAFVSYVASGFVVTVWDIPTLFFINGVLIIVGTCIAYPLLRD